MLGLTLKNLRLQKRMSQDNLSEKLYVVRQTVSKWESGLSTPSAEQLVRLSLIFDVPVEQLLGTNNHNINSDLDKNTQNSMDKHITAAKREDMIITMTNRLKGMNAAGVEMFYSIFKLFPDREQWMASTTPERIEELDAIEALRKQEEENEKEKAANEAQQMADANRKQLYHDYARMFNAIKTIDVPTRYDLEIGEIQAIDCICGGISRYFPEYAFSVAGNYFKYGFVKGMRYAKAKAKKKQNKQISVIVP